MASAGKKKARVQMIEQWIKTPWKEQKSVSKEDSWCEGVVGKDWSAHEKFEAIWSLAASFQEDHEEALINVFEMFNPDRFAAIIDKGRAC